MLKISNKIELKEAFNNEWFISKIENICNKNTKFIKMAINNLIGEGFSVLLYKDKVMFGKDSNNKYVYCGGYFDDDSSVLKCSLRKKNWFLIFIHEYCHYLQFKENMFDKELEKSLTTFDESIGGAKYSSKDMRMAVKVIQKIEHDCERRVIDTAEQYSLHLGLTNSEYTKAAYAYVMSYIIMGEQKKFMKRPISTCQAVLEVMPDNFSARYDVLTKEQRRVFEESLVF